MASEMTNQWEWAAMEPELTPQEKSLRDLFVREYLVDYNELRAAQRCGFQYAFAKDYAAKFMAESYVQKLIKELEHNTGDKNKLEAYNKERVIATLVRVMHDPSAPHSAQVQAASKLAAIYGMDKPVDPDSEDNELLRGGVLLLPDITDNMDDWEKVAKASQAKLIADVRS